MNILQVSPYSLARHGGVQTHVRDLSRALRAAGHQVLCLCPGQGDVLPQGALGLGRMKSISLAGTRFELSLASRAELENLMQQVAVFKPDVVHYHTMWVPMLPWQIFRRLQLPSVATFHDTTSPDATGAVLRSVFRPLSRYLLSKLDGAVAVSTAPLQHLRPGAGGVVPAVIPPAVDLTPFLNVQKPPRTQRPSVLFIGRLEPRKGIGVLLKAWEQVAAAYSGARLPLLVIAGKGECAGEVEGAVARFGDENVRFIPPPHDEELPILLAAATLAVSPATYGESFGIILVESLAAGTPIIGGANAGYRHVLTGAGEQLLVPPGDASALAAKILDLSSDPMRLARLSNWGRSHAPQFGIEPCLSRFLTSYERAIARHNSA